MKVSIRPVTIDDADISWRLRSNPDLRWDYMQSVPSLPASRAKERQYVESVIRDDRTRMFSVFADGEYMGYCSLKCIANGAAELSYCILRLDMRNKGIGTEAVAMVIDYGFDVLKLDMIYRYVHKDNTPSLAMTLRHRFAPVGVSYLNENVERYEMTRTGWTNKRNASK
jgi:diamine N-acetyltransferase